MLHKSKDFEYKKKQQLEEKLVDRIQLTSNKLVTVFLLTPPSAQLVVCGWGVNYKIASNLIRH